MSVVLQDWSLSGAFCNFSFARVKQLRLSITAPQFEGRVKVNSLSLVSVFHSKDNRAYLTGRYFCICMSNFLLCPKRFFFTPLFKLCIVVLSFFLPPFRFEVMSKVNLCEEHGKLKELSTFCLFLQLFSSLEILTLPGNSIIG